MNAPVPVNKRLPSKCIGYHSHMEVGVFSVRGATMAAMLIGFIGDLKVCGLECTG